jgi:hypothetical protein
VCLVPDPVLSPRGWNSWTPCVCATLRAGTLLLALLLRTKYEKFRAICTGKIHIGSARHVTITCQFFKEHCRYTKRSQEKECIFVAGSQGQNDS